MPYAALPDRRMPYDVDGTVVGQAIGALSGITQWNTSTETGEWNDYDYQTGYGVWNTSGSDLYTWWFFPETREVTAFYVYYSLGNSSQTPITPVRSTGVQGSNDTTNGIDGTWETATLGGGVPAFVNYYSWRSGIKPISFTGGKKTIRINSQTANNEMLSIAHLYGEKTAGQTPDDIVYIDHDTTPGVEYQTPEDFGDRPLGTSVVRQFRIKNVSPTKTANTINIQCNDTDFAISTDSVTWVVTINIGSLASGAESATMYIRNTTPAVGGLLGPRHARIVTVVGSWT